MKYKLKHIILLVALLVLQIVWFNHIILFDKFQALIYIFPLLLLPVFQNENTNLWIAFGVGLTMDFFLHTGGVFAGTSVFIVYLRKIYFSFIKNPAQSIKKFRVENLDFGQKIIYYSIFVFLSYIFIYFLESFQFYIVLKKIPMLMVNTIISILFFIFIEYFFIQNPDEK